MILLSVVCTIPANAADSSSVAGQVVTASGSLNVRAEPSSASQVAEKLQKNTLVTLISKSGSWWKVELGQNRYGYCHGDYIRTISSEPKTVKTQSGALNVRSGPGTGYGKTGSVSRGSTVLVLSSSGGWSRILYQGTQTGYVSSQYLSDTYIPIALWVRNMKQMDSRWAQKEVARSGKTFAQIGCATTAIAMLESHRTGIVRYPDEMMTLLNYTATGNVYWPSHYTSVTGNDDLLIRIYQLLKQGKPVLFGATNPYGSQHWVVITGFTGGNFLAADKFTIQDPGSNSRSNLQQFLSIYPNFYKFFYY